MSLSLAAALSLVAAPPAEPQQPVGPRNAEGYILPCLKEESFETCLQVAKDVSLQTSEPVLIMRERENAQASYTLVIGNMRSEVDPKDLHIIIELAPQLPAPVPYSGATYVPAI